jgi:hypothetical protein
MIRQRGRTCPRWGLDLSELGLWNPDKEERMDMSGLGPDMSGQSLWNSARGPDMSGLT